MTDPPDAGADDRATGVSELGFEGALDELEHVLERLEAGELSLEEALATYERGVALSRRAEELLSRAERRIDELVATSDGAELRDFSDEEDEAE